MDFCVVQFWMYDKNNMRSLKEDIFNYTELVSFLWLYPLYFNKLIYEAIIHLLNKHIFSIYYVLC